MTKKQDINKPKVGFYGVTGCAGCLLSVIFNEDEILDIVGALDIVSFPFIKGKNSEEPLDICFIEGTVVSKDDLNTITKLRERSKVIVALGACACNGCIPALRNFCDEKNLDRLKYDKIEEIQDLESQTPLAKHIKVEFSIPGCPPDREEVKTFIKDVLLGKIIRDYPDPVCRECRLFQNGCLLDEKKICLGPLIRGGCHAVCPTNGLECYGCRGVVEDADFDAYFKLLKSKGIDETEIKKHMETFAGLQINEKLKGKPWETLH